VSTVQNSVPERLLLLSLEYATASLQEKQKRNASKHL
jgi:hypothetical protein